MKKQIRFKVIQKCERCMGYGVIDWQRCAKCNTHIAPGEVGTDTLPCGHSVRNYIEEKECGACDGIGEIEIEITLEELRELLQ
jgi:hypothetical protein